MQDAASYAMAPLTDKRVRSQLLSKAFYWLYQRRVPRPEVAEGLAVWISIYAAQANTNWRGQPVAEQGIREASENQEWIAALVSEAMDGAAAVNEQMQNA